MSTPLELGLSLASSAETGDALNDLPFSATFGDKIAGEGASGGAGGSPISGWVNDLAKGVVVALLAKWLWGMMK